ESRRGVFGAALAEYDTVVALDPGMVVLGDLGGVLRLRDGVAAVPQLLPGDLLKEDRVVLEDGLLVIQRAGLGPELAGRLSAGAGEPLGEALAGLLHPVDSRYDFLAYRLYDDVPVPKGVVVLRSSGPAGKPGYGPAEEVRRGFEMDDAAFRTAYC